MLSSLIGLNLLLKSKKMVKEYCILDSQNKFVNSYKTLDEDSKVKYNVIYETPPQINQYQIAFWIDNAWKIKRKKANDDLNQMMLEKNENLKYENLKNEIKSLYTFVPQKKGRFLTHKELINFLEIELNKYRNIIVEKSYNKQKIPKIYKIYIKEIQDKIDIIKLKSDNKNNTVTNFKYYLNENVFDLTEILENKLEADITLEHFEKNI